MIYVLNLTTLKFLKFINTYLLFYKFKKKLIVIFLLNIFDSLIYRETSIRFFFNILTYILPYCEI
jgi:hypothetical protein